MQALSMLVCDMPKVLFERHDLEPRVFDRGGNVKEVRFHIDAAEPLIPVMQNGSPVLLRWGGDGTAVGKLPRGGLTWKDSVQAGKWIATGCAVEPCVIPARYVCDGNIWYLVTEGIHGLIATTPAGTRHVYVICETATRYYRVMTRSQRMPSLVNEII